MHYLGSTSTVRPIFHVLTLDKLFLYCRELHNFYMKAWKNIHMSNLNTKNKN